MFNDVDDIVNKYIKLGYFPSAVCKVFDNEKLLYEKAYGDVNLDTVFDVASLTKLITATEILMLINEGKIKLDGLVSDYLPQILKYRNLRDRLKDVTIRKLLSHSSGIIDWYPFYLQEGSTLKVMDKIICNYEKAEGVMYSDLNFILLAEIIQAVTGLNLNESLDKFIRQRLGIKNICYNPTDKTNIAPTGYGNPKEEGQARDLGISYDHFRAHDNALVGEVHDGNAYYYFDGVAGHAGIFADTEAYMKLCQYYMNTDDELMNMSMKVQIDDRGLGWEVNDNYPEGCGHTGFTGTSVYISKKNNIGVVAFTNRLYTKGETYNINPFRKELHTQVLKDLKGSICPHDAGGR